MEASTECYATTNRRDDPVEELMALLFGATFVIGSIIIFPLYLSLKVRHQDQSCKAFYACYSMCHSMCWII